jgi:hypothetical protein
MLDAGFSILDPGCWIVLFFVFSGLKPGGRIIFIYLLKPGIGWLAGCRAVAESCPQWRGLVELPENNV